jgi:FixJ family two-component response regulator
MNIPVLAQAMLMVRTTEIASIRPILVVDDDPAVRSSLKFALEIEGFSVRTYADAQELLDEPDLPADGCLLIDVNMPGMSGLEVLAVLRARNIAIPAILITGHANPSVLARAAAAAVPVVEKPFTGNALFEAVHSALAHLPRK